ncbi:serine-proline rich protein, partial [Penicillium atrosanguineum]|uniref:serine-proline rich protein n=1 Tax=Penicillium atrosanguineum TaxID=1132637 RepID=UPI00238B3C31
SWRRLLQSPVPDILLWLDIPSYIHGLLIAAFLTANILTISLGTRSWKEAQQRAGALAVIHLLPLCTGFTFSISADLCHLHRSTFEWIHRWLGRICAIHCLLHGTAIFRVVSEGMNLNSPAYVAPLASGCSFLLIPPLTHSALLGRHPQLALKGHYVLIIVALAALGYHLINRATVYRWVFLGGLCLWSSLSGAACIHTLWSHRSWWGTSSEAVATSDGQILWLDIAMPPRWKSQAGQYVQLWMPRSGLALYSQLPLFYVASHEETKQSNAGPVRTLHIVTRSRSSLAVHVLGPFGRPCDFGQYGTVLFIVEDIGLFRALPFIRSLVEESRERRNTVRKLEVLWQVDKSNSNHQPWVSQQIQQVLDLDLMYDRFKTSTNWGDHERRGFDILHFQIHLLGVKPTDMAGLTNRTRLTYCLDQMRPAEAVVRHLNHQCGRMVVAVCASPQIRATVKGTVRSSPREDLQLVDLDLEPSVDWLNGEIAVNGAATTYQCSGDETGHKVVSDSASVLSGRTLVAERDGNEISDSGSVLSGRTLRPTSHQPAAHLTSPTAANHAKWVKQKIAEGEINSRRR